MSQLFFEGLRLIPREGALFRGDERLHLTPKAFGLLRFMAENPQRLLSTDELLDSVWPGVNVGEAVLKVNIRQIRRALGDRARGSRFIETVHRRGYRFLPTVHGQGPPVALSSFVGREQELSELPSQLVTSRLVTLTGAGGCGKTRLALEVASRSAARFADGVFWVELAGLSDPNLVGHEVARCLGVREQPDRQVIDTLVSALNRHEALLVLDNCEHLAEACATVSYTLLHKCPGLRILATSRESLDVSGEIVRSVLPLQVPSRDAGTLDELAQVTSMRLLLDRVRSVVPDFDLNARTAEPLARLCSGLDGLPLALELVAARVPTLGVDALAERLERNVMMALPTSRSAHPRHRTLEATFHWSYRLLDPQEQRMLRSLAVFAGGFTLEAAEAVGTQGRTADGEVAGLISRLVLRSLVEASSPSGPVRYRLLEPIRQPAAGLLESRGEAEPIGRRHAAFFLAEAERAAPHLESGQRQIWLAALESDRENVRAALGRLGRQETESRALVRLATALLWYWYHLGHWSEARRWLERSVAVIDGADLDPDLRSRALYALGLLDFFTGRYEIAAAHLERAAAEAGKAGAPRRRGLALGFWAMTRLATGAVDDAVSLAELGLESSKSSSDDWATALSLVNLGNALRGRGDLDRARSLYEQSAALLSRPRDPWALAMAIRNLGIVDAMEGRLESAAERFRASLGELEECADRWFVSRGLEELGAVLSRQGEHRRAARLLGAAEALRRVIGAPVVSFYRQGYDEALAALRSALPEEVLAEAWAEGQSMCLHEALDEARSPRRSRR